MSKELFLDATQRVHSATVPEQLVAEQEMTEKFRRAFFLSCNEQWRRHANAMERTFESIPTAAAAFNTRDDE